MRPHFFAISQGVCKVFELKLNSEDTNWLKNNKKTTIGGGLAESEGFEAGIPFKNHYKIGDFDNSLVKSSCKFRVQQF